MTVSLWNRLERPEDIRTDTLVIGAGIVGIGCALELQRRSVDYRIIDRLHPGAGASTRNAGFLMRGAADNYAFACDTLGRERTRALWAWTEENLAILREHDIAALSTYRATPSCLLAITDNEAAELTRSAQLMREDGFRVDLLESHTDTPWRHPDARLALINPDDATINPRQLIDTLAARLTQPILTHTDAFAIDLDRADHILIHTSRARIRAQRLLLCINAWTAQLLPDYAHRIVPNRGQMLALHAPTDHPNTPALSFAYYLNRGGEYLRRPDPDTIIVGGCRRHFETEERTLADATTPALQQSLEDFAAELLAHRFPVKARWSGPMAFTADGIPIVEPLPENPNAVVCAGFTGHGMSLGIRTARAAVDLALDHTPPPLPLLN